MNRPFKKVGWFISSLAATTKEAYAIAKGDLAYLLASPTPFDDFDRYGINIDHEAIRVALMNENVDKAVSYVRDEVVEHYTVSGSPAQFKKQLRAFLDAGVDYPVLALLGSIANKQLAIELALEVCN